MPELFVEHIEMFYIYYIEPELNDKYPLVYENFIEEYISKAKTRELFHV